MCRSKLTLANRFLVDLLEELLVKRKAVRTMADTLVVSVAFPTSGTAVLITRCIEILVIALAGTVFAYQKVNRSMVKEGT